MIKIFSCYYRSDLLARLEMQVYEFLTTNRKTKNGKTQKPEAIQFYPAVADGYYFLTIHYKIVNL